MTTDQLIFLVVVGLRFGIPLLIPRFALPAIVACLVLDAADQTIFQQFTDLNLDGYQGYDKALDIFYLAIAYLSTIRNWFDPIAYGAARFLWYYRLVGVVLFELTETRALLIIFPNTFEYFFIAYEAVRCMWDPTRLRKRQVYLTVAFIWIFIKLPQEWWLHIAQLDFTDFMKRDVLGTTPETSWGTALSQNWWFVALMVAVVVLVVYGIRRLRTRLPEPDWSFTFDVDKHIDRTAAVTSEERAEFSLPLLVEKIALTSLVTVIFAQLVPDSDASPLQIAVAVAVLVGSSSAISHWMSRRGVSWSSIGREFGAMMVVNMLIAVAYVVLLRRSDTPVNEAALVFFVVLLTLLVTLFDRFQGERTAWERSRPNPPGITAATDV
jgi:hypothetical protein